MSFLYPLGLLGLLAIPLLILIYILKNKHTEQVVSSTYLWTLSERFLKRRNPISRIAGIISLILQILIVAMISFALAHPVFTLKNAANDYVFILDASGSMAYEQEAKTRFELGKERVAEIVEDSVNGSSYTLIHVGASTGATFENLEDKEQALKLLEEANLSSTEGDYTSAKSIAQEYFAQRPASKIYLITDKEYQSLENVELIRIAEEANNYALAELSYTLQSDGLAVTGKAYSYAAAQELTIQLEVRNGENVSSQEQTIPVEKSVEQEDGSLLATEFSFKVTGDTAFQSLTVRIVNEDDLPVDNESVLYNVTDVEESSDGSNGILLVSKDPFFLRTALSAFYAGSVEWKTPDEYAPLDGSVTGKKLYIFEGYSPSVLPDDGAVWFVNPQGSVADSGFSTSGTAEVEGVTGALTYNDSTATRIQELLKGTDDCEINIKEYVKCSFYRKFHTLLDYNGSPIVFAGTNGYENREVVFAFDFHKSDFVLTTAYVVLMRNLLEYTFPQMLTETSYYCGESVSINVLANCEWIRVDAPSGEIAYLDVGSDLAEYDLNEVGTYKITQMVGKDAKTVYVYGNLPMAERTPVSQDESFVVAGTPVEERRDGRYDDLIILFIILAAIFIADWAVYCYEQYQLR